MGLTCVHFSPGRIAFKNAIGAESLEPCQLKVSIRVPAGFVWKEAARRRWLDHATVTGRLKKSSKNKT
jgi:hypothetical protein